MIATLLTDGQAQAFRREAVLSRTGPAGNERIEPWAPWAMSADPPSDMVVAPDELQAAIDRVLHEGGRHRRHIRLSAGQGAGPVYIPKSAPPLTISAPDGARLDAPVDAEMSGAEYRRRFAGRFARAHSDTRAIFDRIAAKEKITTHNASVLRIEADDTVLRGLSIENTYACDRASAAPAGAVPDAQGRYSTGQHQAVALHVAGADRVVLDGLELTSFQDTLYLQHPGAFSTARTYVTGCRIAGDVDFIFGQATAFFDDCTIISRGDRGAMSWATAPATSIGTSYGFVFDGCRFVSDRTAGAAPGRFLLGRQWFEGVRATPYGTPDVPGYVCRFGDASRYDPPEGTISRATLESVGKCVVLRSTLGPHLHPTMPWGDWNGGDYGEDGTYLPAPWNPRFRPVQTGPARMAERLQNWLAREGLRLSEAQGPVTWLGLYQPRRE